MAEPYGVIPAPVPTSDDLARAKSRSRLEAADRLGYFIPPEIKDIGRRTFGLASAIDPAQGILRGMSASGRAFDEDLPDDVRRQAAIEAALETLAPLGLVGIGKLAKEPAEKILLDVLTPTGAPASVADDVAFDPGRRKFLQQSLAAASTAAVAPDILSDLGTKATKTASKAVGNIDAAVAKLLKTRRDSSALIEKGLQIQRNVQSQTPTPRPPKDNTLPLDPDYADSLARDDQFRQDLIDSGNMPEKEMESLYRQGDELSQQADEMADSILETVGTNPEILPQLEEQTIEDLIGSFNIDAMAQKGYQAYQAVVEEAIRRGMHKDYEKYPMTDLAAEYILDDIADGATSGLVDLSGVDLDATMGNYFDNRLRPEPPVVIQEGVLPQDALELTDDDIALFRRPALEGGRGTTEEFRKALKGRNEELTEAANKLKNNEITVREYRQIADRIRPIKELDRVPQPATFREVVSALDAGKRKKPIVGLTTSLSEGDEITARLDINAYTDYDVWVPTLTHNKQTMYKPTVVMRNVEFIQPDSPAVKKAMNVAAGQAKAPFAVMKGNYVDVDDLDAFGIAQDNFKSDEWIQVGYDPTKRGYFYDRATGEPVLSAEEVVQVGSLVLAKRAIKGDADAFAFNKGGMAMDEQMNAVFKSSRTGYAVGGSVDLDSVPDNTVGMDPVSGNEIPLGSLPEEVRDDIPAQLSEGEYVVPADVVRYYGVKFFEDLRAKAKFGYQDMEENGRIGGEPAGMEMVEPEDDMMFDISELEVIDTPKALGFNQGGYALNPGDPGYDEMGSLGLGSEGIGLGTGEEGVNAVEMVAYVHEDGRVIYILHINGVPQNEIPAGFYPRTEEEDATEEDATDAQPEAQVVVQNDDDGGPDIEPPTPIDYNKLTLDEIQEMINDQKSPKMNVVAAGLGALNPLMGLFMKGAMMHQAKQLQNEMNRRLAGELTTQDRTRLEGMLKEAQESGGLLKKIIEGIKGDEEPEATEPYTPEVAAGSVTLPTTPKPEGMLETSTDDLVKAFAVPEGFAREEYKRAQLKKAQQKVDNPPTVEYSQSGTDDVIQSMKDRDAPQAAVQAAQKEAEKVQGAVSDINRGIQRGFKKGGLASKKKK